MAQSLKKLRSRSEENNREVSINNENRHPLENMRRQFENLFHDVASMPLLFSRQQRFDLEPFWNTDFTIIKSPAVDIVENEKSFVITAEVPGVDEKQLSVKVANGTLVLKGEKLEDRDESSKSYHMTERRYGAFERIFNLPKGVNAEQIKAGFKSGVLKVTLPKKAEAMQPEKTVDIHID